MKKTEQRWMHSQAGRFADRGLNMSNKPDYELVTVVRDVPEWEEVEEVRWINIFDHPCEPIGSRLYRTLEAAQTAAHGEKAIQSEIHIPIRRRKPEPEVEAWEGVVSLADTLEHYADGIIYLDSDWIGKKVRVEVVE